MNIPLILPLKSEAIQPVVPKIEVARLNVTFAGPRQPPVHILNDVSFTVPAGQFVAVVGPSGCGKSTLLRVLAGLVAPASGEARIDGVPVSAPPPGVGFMFQRDTLLPWASVAENIALGAELAGVEAGAIAVTVPRLVSFLGLDGFAKHRPHQLSGGMRQRVALGRLLAYEPELFLMDEPFGALDAQTKIVMGRELLRIWATQRRSVIFVTHDVAEAVTLADRVIVLSARPGSIKLDLAIDLERPRDLKSLRKSSRFGEYCEAVWTALGIESALD